MYFDGLPTEVWVDEYFPVDKTTGKMFFSFAGEGELWVSLLEKAYAKLRGDLVLELLLLVCRIASCVQSRVYMILLLAAVMNLHCELVTSLWCVRQLWRTCTGHVL